jgi:hypothetical protein
VKKIKWYIKGELHKQYSNKSAVNNQQYRLKMENLKNTFMKQLQGAGLYFRS